MDSQPQLVRILIDGVYNGPDHKTLGPCKVGEIVAVAGSTAHLLLEDGFVEIYDEQVERAEQTRLDAELRALDEQIRLAQNPDDSEDEEEDGKEEPATVEEPKSPKTPKPKTRRTQKLV